MSKKTINALQSISTEFSIPLPEIVRLLANLESKRCLEENEKKWEAFHDKIRNILKPFIVKYAMGMGAHISSERVSIDDLDIIDTKKLFKGLTVFSYPVDYVFGANHDIKDIYVAYCVYDGKNMFPDSSLVEDLKLTSKVKKDIFELSKSMEDVPCDLHLKSQSYWENIIIERFGINEKIKSPSETIKIHPKLLKKLNELLNQ